MTANSLPMLWTDGTRELCNHLWQSTCFAGVVWLLTLLLRRYQARTRYWLWMAASVKLLIPFSLLAVVVSQLKWMIHARESQTATFLAIHQMSQPFTEVTGLGTPITSLAAPLPASHDPVAPLVLLLAAVWLLGFIAVLAFWLVQWRRVSKSVRTATPLEDGREVEALRRMERITSLQRPMEIIPSPDAMEPGVFGILRPVLLWPEGISRHLDDAHLEAVLAHEVCHVRWRDNLTSAIHMLVSAVFWFHPLVWWMEKQLVKERELACDEEVVSLCNQPQVYAESILKVCEFCIESPAPCVSGITGADLKQRVVQIMTGRIGLKLSLGMKMLLIAAATVGLASGVLAGVRPSLPVLAQILHPAGPLPSYEVATIKPASDNPTPAIGSRNVRRFTGNIKALVESAYNVPYGTGDRVIGGPSWLNNDRYVIDGMVPDDASVKMKTMSPTEQREQIALMKQSLLVERFKLKVHFEMREMPVYELVVAKGGAKVKPTTPADPNAPPPRNYGFVDRTGPNDSLTVARGADGVLEMTTKGKSMDSVARDFVETVDDIGGRTIVNKTGLDGRYDFTLNWAPQQTAAAPGENSAAPENNAPSIFTALQEQLGLKLVPAKGMVEVVVIDSIERPSPN